MEASVLLEATVPAANTHQTEATVQEAASVELALTTHLDLSQAWAAHVHH